MFFPPTRLATPDFMLRCYLPGDGAQVFEAVNSSVAHLFRFLDWAQTFPSIEAAEALVRGFHARYITGEDFLLPIWSPDGEELWGGTGFRLRDGGKESGIAEISMWIRESQAGRGLGSAVLKALIHWGFAEWGFERLYWRCRADNAASARAAEKAGMTLEARLRRQHPDHMGGHNIDTLFYAMLKSEWSDFPYSESLHPNYQP
jgi:RimJ/RimL family protein N-acetyltransferase